MEKEPRSDFYEIDCVEFMKKLPDKYFSLCIADPPYSNEGKNEIAGGRFHRGRFSHYLDVVNANKWDKMPSDEFFEELFRVSQNQIIFGANYFDCMPATRCFLIWKKQIPESFTMAMCEYAWTSFNGNAKIIECSQISKVGDKRFHPTQKPIELYAWILRNYAKDGDLVFDPMAGSGSSSIAAYQMGIDYVGCEIEPTYYNKANERFERLCRGVITMASGEKLVQTNLFA